MSILLINEQPLRHNQIQLILRLEFVGDMKQAQFFFNLFRGPRCLARRYSALNYI